MIYSDYGLLRCACKAHVLSIFTCSTNAQIPSPAYAPRGVVQMNITFLSKKSLPTYEVLYPPLV